MKHCENCRFWSEMIAKGAAGGGVDALCLADGPHNGNYMHAAQTCEAWKSAHLGAVDDPHEDPARYEGEPDDMEELGTPGPADDYPFRVYLFDDRGMHDGGKWLRNEQQLEAAMLGPIKSAVEAKREVRITDSGDCLVFHAQDGRVLFPTREQA